MTKFLYIVLFLVLVLGGVFVLVRGREKGTIEREQEVVLEPEQDKEEIHLDSNDPKAGQQFGDFVVESVTKDENGDENIQLRGEKVVRERFFFN